jgi:transcriptional regulator with XRE-family HTH domain
MKKAEFTRKIGTRIADLRVKKGWNQSDLARACQKDRQAVEKLENGAVNATVYSLFEISAALEVPMDELFKF